MPERAVRTLLNAALSVTEHTIREAHPLVGSAVGEPERDTAAEVLICLAKLIVGRCVELRDLVELYDAQIDRLYVDDGHDDDITF